jgi:glycosyltransferase 2 family protein
MTATAPPADRNLPPVGEDAVRPPVPHSLFASAGHEPRRRRFDDVALFGIAVAAVLGAGLVADGPTKGGAEAAAAVNDLLGWLDPFWSFVYAGSSVLVVLLLLAALIGRRWALARDIVLAVALTYGLGALLAYLVDGHWPSLPATAWGGGHPTYPALRVAVMTAVALVSLPDLARPVRYLVLTLVGLSLPAVIVLGNALPAQALGGLGLGAGIGAALRLVFGSSAGFPQERRVRADLAELGVAVPDVWRDERQRGGVARYRAVDGAGADLAVAVYGRDARDTQLVARMWRMLWYRDGGPEAALTRRGQVEHEALLLFAAARAGAPVPAVLAAGTVGGGDALLVIEQPDVPALAELDGGVDAALVDRAWAAAAALRSGRIAHGRLNAWSILAPAGGGVVVSDFAGARLNADDDMLATDLVELLVSSALLVSPERALAAARRAMGDDAVRDALPYLQRAALSPTLRDEVRAGDLDVNDLRQRVVDATGGEMPEIAALRRVSVRDVVLVGLTAFAAYLLISQIADIGIDTIVDELKGAEWAWVLFALALAQLTLVTDAWATLAAVGRPLPTGPTIVLQSAVKFINLTVPSSAGKIALTMRFLERQGVERAVALTQGSIDGVAGFVVQALVLLVVVPTSGIHLDLQAPDSGALIKLGIIVVVGAVVAAILALALPGLRRKVWPFVSAAWTNARDLATSPGRLVRLLGANLTTQVVYAVVLGSALHAFGASASLGDLLLVNTGVSLLSGLLPVPGGIGVAEAGYTAGLAAVGVPQSAALAATLVHRMCTYYLPPVWGWFALRWLGRKGFV